MVRRVLVFFLLSTLEFASSFQLRCSQTSSSPKRSLGTVHRGILQPRHASSEVSNYDGQCTKCRRSMLANLVSLPFSMGIMGTNPTAAADEPEISVYFGVGCFWHVQHEFVEAERKILKRDDSQLTALAGYAGGTKIGKDPSRPGAQGLVCYHNFQQIADYGKLGHGEVVGLSIPPSVFKDFTGEYFKLFDKQGDRPDKGDRGLEYRSIVGLPGGINGPLFPELKAAADVAGIKLVEGKGNDGDTLGKKMIWVMDSKVFPFYQGEVYHQYHDGFFPGEDYAREYNGLQVKFTRSGKLETTGCPDVI